MKTPAPSPGLNSAACTERAAARPLVLGTAFFLLGLAVSAILFSRLSNHESASKAALTPSPLTDSTRAVLQRLVTPVELRFYSLLDTSSVPSSLVAFAGRVDQLLTAYQQEAGGKIKLLHNQSLSNSVENTALGDGLKPFNLDKGEGCYLGVAVVLNGRKETLPQLSPEWESALQPDLSRAISHLIDAAAPPPNPNRDDPAIAEEVKKTIPDPSAVSLEEGTRVLREASINEFKATGQEMAAKIKAAQERILEAQKNQSAAEQQAAVEALKAVQAEQQAKLSQIAERSQLQIEALKQLKTAALTNTR